MKNIFLIGFVAFCFIALLCPSNLISEEKKDPAFDEGYALERLKAAIAGKEKEPAETVFQNIQVLKGMPAERLLAVMKIGYSKSLGVDCAFCHNTIHWEMDEKIKKQTAREMILMTRHLNQEVLPQIKGLEDKNPAANCTTCHRGQTKPALDIE